MLKTFSTKERSCVQTGNHDLESLWLHFANKNLILYYGCVKFPSSSKINRSQEENTL